MTRYYMSSAENTLLLYIQPSPDSASLTLKMTSAMHSETLEELQHTTRLNSESRKYAVDTGLERYWTQNRDISSNLVIYSHPHPAGQAAYLHPAFAAQFWVPPRYFAGAFI
jgi:hypothetical protein